MEKHMSSAPFIGLIAGLLGAFAMATQALAADKAAQDPVPNFSSIDFPWFPATEFLPPSAGPGQVTYDKAHPVTARILPDIPTAAIPTVQCIHRVLKSSCAIQSVTLYSLDGIRFATEYVFRNKNSQAVAYDIELIIEANGTVTETDKIPREVSKETADGAQDLESKLDLLSQCHIGTAFDNLIPGLKARAEWRKIDWPGG
jgi:hypothetical protein